MIYKKSKYKVTALVICCCLLFLGGIAYFLYSAITRNSYSANMVLVIFSVTYLIITINKIKPQYSQTLEIGDKIINRENKICTAFDFDKIQSIVYSGTKLIPMSEMLLIKAQCGIIYVDFNYIDYQKAWRDVVTISVCKNPHIIVQKKVLKRLKMAL